VTVEVMQLMWAVVMQVVQVMQEVVLMAVVMEVMQEEVLEVVLMAVVMGFLDLPQCKAMLTGTGGQGGSFAKFLSGGEASRSPRSETMRGKNPHACPNPYMRGKSPHAPTPT
jgi:hypothetical protein